MKSMLLRKTAYDTALPCYLLSYSIGSVSPETNSPCLLFHRKKILAAVPSRPRRDTFHPRRSSSLDSDPPFRILLSRRTLWLDGSPRPLSTLSGAILSPGLPGPLPSSSPCRDLCFESLDEGRSVIPLSPSSAA